MAKNSVEQSRNFRGSDLMSYALPGYSDVVRNVLSHEYGRLKNGVKLLARDARTSPRTAENWLAGTNAPNGEKLINLLASCEALAEEINRLVAERRAARGEK